MSDLLWIAVPGGRAPDGGTRLSIVVVPRLDGSRTLEQEGLAVWPPPGLAGLALAVEFRPSIDAPPTPPVPITALPSAQAGLWSEFFGRIEVRTPLGPIDRPMAVVQSSRQAAAVEAAYQQSAGVLAGVIDAPETLELIMPEDELFDLLGPELLGPELLGDGTTTTPDDPPPPPRRARDAMPVPDFNAAISLLREHPPVLRALGLILDVVVPAGAAPSTDGVVQVRWDDPSPGLPPIISPWTAYRAVPFRPAPAPGSDLHVELGGMVRLADEDRWRFATIDIDHAVEQLRAADPTTIAAGLLPALRTAGLCLLRAGRASRLDASRRNPPNRTDLGTPLTAESLTLGYRIDVQIDSSDMWLSLCRRVGTYKVNDTEFFTDHRDEGHLKINSAVDHGDNVLRSDEIIARWDGWSLAAPRPALDGRPPSSPPVSSEMPFDLRTSFQPERESLPRLEFGSRYRMRARVADIAGGGMTAEDDSLDECDSQTIRFTRNEPVRAPEILLPEGVDDRHLTLGASRYQLVVRAADGVAASDAETFRVLAPPVAAFDVIERHGRFTAPAATTFDLFRRDVLPDPLAEGVAAFLTHDDTEGDTELETSPWRSEAGGEDDAWPDLAAKGIRLSARQPGEPTLDWEDETLHVRLAPAQQVTVDLSSSLRRDAIADLSLAMWLEGLSPGGGDLLTDGRHPMASPPQRLTLLHAVKQPKLPPAGSFTVRRAEGQTFADLDPSPDLLDIDVASTGTLEVSASWRPGEDLDDPVAEGRPVDRVTVARTDTGLRAIRHEFGDTKHREVTYTLTARSRFRQFFPDTVPARDFLTEGSTGVVTIVSSARPAPPVVLAAVPAFVWTEERSGSQVIRRRLGHRVRVELARPWFTTGDGERLAVVPTLSQVGKDPIWDTTLPGALHLAAPAEQARLADGSATVAVVPHGVWSVGDSWYADVAFDSPGSYCPLAQLAVARYQPDSVSGLELSATVLTDFVPLLPDRTLTIELSGDTVIVTLSGLTQAGPVANRVDAILELGLEPDGSGSLRVLGTSGDNGLVWRATDIVSGAVGEPLTMARPAGVEPLRVRVREVEGIGDHLVITIGSSEELQERTVYTDTVRLD